MHIDFSTFRWTHYRIYLDMDINLDKIWISQHIQMDIWLVVWNIFYFSIQLGIRWTTDFHMFQRGRSTTNQICFTMDIFDMLIHFGYGSMDQNWASQHNFSWSKLPLLVPLDFGTHIWWLINHVPCLKCWSVLHKYHHKSSIFFRNPPGVLLIYFHDFPSNKPL